jgi:hypothetical protein
MYPHLVKTSEFDEDIEDDDEIEEIPDESNQDDLLELEETDMISLGCHA